MLAIENYFFEFIPQKNQGEENPPCLGAHQVQKDRIYSLVVTSPSGLYRYEINDLIQIKGFYFENPIISFIRKGRDMANMCGEKIHVNHLLSAFKKLKEKGYPLPPHFSVVPDFKNLRYLWNFEGEKNQKLHSMAGEISNLIDSALKYENQEYKAKRDSTRLNPPLIQFMKKGWVEFIQKNFQGDHRKDVQFKWKYLTLEFLPGENEFIY